MAGREPASESRYPSARRGGELNQAIANAVVRTRTHFTGHGPSRAQAFHRGNVVVVLLHEPLGPAERLLDVNGGRGKVLEMRAEVREAMAGDARPRARVADRLHGAGAARRQPRRS